MLSICIPIYNHDVTSLINSLHKQGVELNIPFEIILADDASEQKFRQINHELDSLENIVYIQLNENIGRAKIRNYLAEKATYNHLLFMDCDSMTNDDNYLERYASCSKEFNVICGGRSHYPYPDDDRYKLRWKYGVRREEKSANHRNIEPNNSFMTNNFLINKKLFKQFYLNESITGYGHEDTYFGYRLKKAGIKIYHINNPLIHAGLESSDVYLLKTKEAINNLLKIYKITGYDNDFADMVSLLKTFCFIKKWKLNVFLRFIYNLSGNAMEKNLTGKNPRIWIFDLHKLGYLCKIAPKLSIK